MKLTKQQKATIVRAYQRWQQRTAAAQHRSANILPGMQALQRKGTVRSCHQHQPEHNVAMTSTGLLHVSLLDAPVGCMVVRPRHRIRAQGNRACKEADHQFNDFLVVQDAAC